jgi:hypothetical protein
MLLNTNSIGNPASLTFCLMATSGIKQVHKLPSGKMADKGKNILFQASQD